MTQRLSLSARYINALRQLPQYHCVIGADTGQITHMLTGARVTPLGDLTDPDDECNTLQIEFAGGRKIEVVASAYFDIAVGEAAQLEAMTDPLSLCDKKELTGAQRRSIDLNEHLRRKHDLS